VIDTILVGDVRSCLKQVEDGSVQCVITSPPYWGLRDYGTAKWEGGDPDCDHLGPPKATQAGFNERWYGKAPVASNKQGELRIPYRGTCGKCGARRVDNQLGLEPTPEAYVADLVAVFREVKRVLREDGTVWLNLGDSYAGSGKGRMGDGSHCEGGKQATDAGSCNGELYRTDINACKPKDLVGIPWMVAFALRADGWWLRSEIIWAKPGPMPESVQDRPTRSHEQVFLLEKSGRPLLWVHRDHAYHDAVYVEPEPDYRWTNVLTTEEVAVEPKDWATAMYLDDHGKEQKLWERRNLWRSCEYYYDAEAIKELASPHSDLSWPRNGASSTLVVPGHRTAQHGKIRTSVKRGGFNGKTSGLEGREAFRAITEMRNKRDVWTVATQPCAEAHFATFPAGLIDPMILAGSPEGGVVLDPFMGSGTTAIECVRLHRHYIGCELNPKYVKMAERRIRDMIGPLFTR